MLLIESLNFAEVSFAYIYYADLAAREIADQPIGRVA